MLYHLILENSGVCRIFTKTKWPEQIYLPGAEFGGEHSPNENSCAVRVRAYKKSRNYRLSISAGGEAVLSVPESGSLKDATTFLNRQRGWLEKKLQARPKPTPFIDGANFPLQGKIHQIKATGKMRALVEICHNFEGRELEIPLLLVPGGEQHMARRLRDWLKKRALEELMTASNFHAQRLGVSPANISIRSQSSRWGSCSSAGKLNYNWRLIMAPGFVLDYVAAHEVAHLCEMNHSTAFWNKVKQTLPDMENGRDWLKKNGNQLMAYGFKSKEEK